MIGNSRNHPTEKMAKYVEEQLKNKVTNQTTFKKHTNDFLN